jgi:competence protein ComEA
MTTSASSTLRRSVLRLAAASLLAVGLAGAASAQTAAPSAKPATPAAAPAATTPAAPLIDINSATKEELSALKGIGPARSDAIVKGRPYKGKDELVRKSIIPESVYADIKDQIIAKQK